MKSGIFNRTHKSKICFVVQRYGKEICGGAEAHCKQYVDRLKSSYDITVLTSRSINYDTWENEYSKGPCKVDGVAVIRFSAIKRRSHEYTKTITPPVYDDPYHDMETAAKWLKSIGPECPDMIRYVIENRDKFELFVFIGYMYYTTTMVMPYVADKAVLVPTAHDEDALNRCNYFKMQFNLPRALLPSTEEEIKLIRRRFHNEHIPAVLGGVGIELPPQKKMLKSHVKKKYRLPEEYVVYVGRIDETKSCDELFEAFLYYKQKYNSCLKLILVGQPLMDIPADFITTGFVDDIDKFALMHHAKALILPSKVESLSMVTLEAMALGVPVLLRAQCEVLKAHVEKSKAGLYFYQKEDFADALNYIVINEESAVNMGNQGKDYVQKNYNWDMIISRIENLFEGLIKEKRELGE